MPLKWPDNYQKRIENIIGAKYDRNNHVYFLGYDFETIREANNCIKEIQLMQKQLRQIKTEISNKIKVVKAQRLPRANKKDPWGVRFAKVMTDFSTGRKINNYKYVIFNIDKLLDACENRKLEIIGWIDQQKQMVIENPKMRKPIPDDVQIFVWNRDGGKCVKCGSQENLEFDHIIPVSKGGSNTARNIQLLCETCNRKKSNVIGA